MKAFRIPDRQLECYAIRGVFEQGNFASGPCVRLIVTPVGIKRRARTTFVRLGLPLVVGAGIVLFWWSDDPFTMPFRLGLLLILSGFLIGIVVVSLAFSTAHRIVARVIGIALLVVTVASISGALLVLRRARWVFRKPLTRSEWQVDAQYLVDLIPSVHPDAFAHVSRDVYTRQSRDLQAGVTTGETDAQIEMSLVHLVASLQDGHSTLFPFQPATGFHMLPLQVYAFSDGWYVTAASPTYAPLVGRRVMRIGDQSIEQVFALVQPFVGADNDSTIRDRAPLYLLCPEVLQALGIGGDPAKVNFVLADEHDHVDEVTIMPVGLLTYLYWYFQPLHPWKRKPKESGLPLYRQMTWDNYWFRYLPEHHAVYVAFNQVRDKSGETFEAFGRRVLRFCREQKVQKLIIDVRNNSGGDNTIFQDFIASLNTEPINAHGRLFVIIGHHTFSAAVNFVSAMERNTQAIFAGEPAGAGPNHFGDPKRYVLPHSKLLVFIASRYHQWGQPADMRRAHEPTIEISPTHSDFFAGRDPVLERILGTAAAYENAE